MLPIILGAVALGTVGYGVKRCLDSDSCIDNLKDTIQDGAISLYDGIEKLEDKMGLNEVIFSSDDLKEYPISKTTNHSVGSLSDNFEKLYKLKLDTHKQISKYMTDVIDIQKIKKDKTSNITITEEMNTNLASYIYLLKTISSKTRSNVNSNTDEINTSYLEVLRELYTTKIIKKGKFNDKSTELILNATKVLLGKKEPMHVELNVEPLNMCVNKEK